jgi:hypothetical protein
MKPQKLLPLFRHHGLEPMAKAYEANMRFLGFSFKQALWRFLTGFRFHHFVNEIVRGLGDMQRLSMSQSAWDTLGRLGFDIETKWLFDRSAIAGRPVLLYASHPSYVEPFLCLAALKDMDPVIVATGWLKNISPGISERIIGIWDSKAATAEYVEKFKGIRRLLEALFARVVTYRVVEHLQGDMTARQCAASRRASLKEMLSTLGACKPLFVYPSGGDGQKFWVGERTDHFENLLRFLIGGLKRYPSLERLCFVPVVRNGSLRALFKSDLWEQWHPFSMFSKILPARPFRFVMREYVELAAQMRNGMNTAGIAKDLMERLKP